MVLPKALRPTSATSVTFPSGTTVSLPVCHPTFLKWTEPFTGFAYGGKPILNYEGEAVFAELAILRLLRGSGWEGVWVETYGGTNFLREMPQGWQLSSLSVAIPEERCALLKKIWKAAKTTACFDVFAWKEEDILLCEAKHQGKDQFTKSQLKFIEGALACGIPSESLLIVEWTME